MQVFSISNFAEAAPGGVEAGAAPGGDPRAVALPPPAAFPPGDSRARIVPPDAPPPPPGQRRTNPETGLETVIGPDDRAAVAETDRDPWRRICQLDLRGPAGTFKGTGWFAGPATVVTAGHCLHYRPFFGGWAQEIVVAPGRHMDSRPFGTAASGRFSVLSPWFQTEAADYDIGCIHLDLPLGAATGHFAVVVADDAALEGAWVNVAGYPTDRDMARVAYHHANRIMALTPRRMFYEIDTASGQSGGPVWMQADPEAAPVCVGVHAYGVPGTPADLHIRANSAPRFDADIAAIVAAWVAADNRRCGLA